MRNTTYPTSAVGDFTLLLQADGQTVLQVAHLYDNCNRMGPLALWWKASLKKTFTDVISQFVGIATIAALLAGIYLGPHRCVRTLCWC
jgi:hypothetical protein